LKPVLEATRKHPAADPPARTPAPVRDETAGSAVHVSRRNDNQSALHSVVPDADDGTGFLSRPAETRRLEALKARQDLECRKREIMQWRSASRAPGQHAGTRRQTVEGRPSPEQ
jgi:hypothetical protein